MLKFKTGLSIVLAVALLLPSAASVSASTSGVQITGYLERDPGGVSIQQTLVSDPLFSQQVGLSKMNITTAWSQTKGSPITIAVVDTGISSTHEDLRDKLWVNPGEIAANGVDDDRNGFVDDYHGYNFVNNNSNVGDGHGHGTGIASIIAASTNNAKGIAGVNWPARIMTVRSLNANGGGDFDDVAKGIRYAADNGAKVINLSFGSVENISVLAEAIKYAQAKDVIIAAAAGNNGSSGVFYPAAYPGVLAVGAVDRNDRRSTFSNYGSGVDLAALGERVTMADRDPAEYTEGYGTSFAAAFVTGVAGLILAKSPALSYLQVAEAVVKSATPISATGVGGRLDAAAALSYAPATVSSSATLTGNNAPATGVDVINVSLSLAASESLAGRTIRARISGSNNIVNSRLVGSEPVEIGTADSNGMVKFSLSSTMPETKTITFETTGAQITTVTSATFARVINPRFQMAWVSQSPYPTLRLGETAKLTLQIRNIGNIAWIGKASNNAVGQLRLGTDRAQDRTSVTFDTSWLSPNRVVAMTESIVRPGEVANFEFIIRGQARGQYKEYFKPVIEHVSWLNDLGIYWDIKVN